MRLEGASFGYGPRNVLAGVDLRVQEGDFLGIVGPNGAGKTTLFRGILGLLEPTAGRVVRAQVPLGYVPQREALDAIFPLTVCEVVAMGCRARTPLLRRLPAAEHARAHGLLERVELSELRDALFASLSGGQRQRALIARALMAQPRLLLLDEPTSGIDRNAERVIQQVLRDLHAQGLAILIVSHQLALVRETVQQVLWVSGGRVRAGDPHELLRAERLDQLFTADSGAAP